jgi:hypothetical protein
MFTYGHRLRLRSFQATTKSLEWVKRSGPTAKPWGRGGVYGTVEKTICKLSYQFRMSLRNND